MSVFDPDTLLNNTDSGAMDTVFMPVPAGEYHATIESVKPRQAKESVIADIVWLIQDQQLLMDLGRDKVTVRQSLFLDMTEHGSLDRSKGKNVQLGKLRDAVGQNDPDKPWGLANLVGATAMISVTQRPDPKNPETIYNDVKKVVAF